MEDRQPTGLWLEMWPADESSVRQRAGVLRDAGLGPVHWFANCRRDRDDLPRRLDEFDLLVVAECEAADVEAAYATLPAGDGRTLGFRRYPRASQGALSPHPTAGLLLVLISPKTPDQAQALRDWADFVHLRHIAAAAVPGYSVITPYECVTAAEPRFMHFYEMDADDPEATFKAMTPLVGERLGGFESEEFRAWAGHPALRIEYVNTFRRIGRA